MSKDTIFGVKIQEVERQCKMNPIHCDKNSPINEKEYLQPCLRGTQKILSDSKKRELIKRIYRR